MERQLDLAIKMRDDLTRLAETVHRIRSVRKQLTERNELLKDDAKAEALIKGSKAFIERLDALEAKLHNPKAEVSYDILGDKRGAQLYSKMSALFDWIKDGDGAPLGTKVLDVVIPVAVAVAYGFALNLKRRSTKFRVTTTVIEYERGLISKRIDMVQLWRIRDVVYKQTIVDRMLGIAHVEVVAQDVKNPDLEIVGMPASRQLFEQLRDSIEIQRQHKNVYGVVS